MNAKKRGSHRSLKSDLRRVDAHVIQSSEYEELPELNPRKLISLRLPANVIARWKATGPGWQTRMAERLSKVK
jgi:uncharacterized protein (DUF4415 family)